MKSLIWKHRSDNIKSGKYVYIVWEEDDCVGTKVVKFKNTSQLYQQHKIPWCNITKWAYLSDLVNATYKVDEIKKQNEILSNKLDIAINALKEYADQGNWDDCLSWNGYMDDSEVVEKGQYGIHGYNFAQKALEGIGVIEKDK